MIQGTASHVGKSILTSALCRLFVRRGRRVAPFKAQNMSNNSFVTPDGYEIGRAQAVQARACRILPRRDMNPLLIKPSSDCSAQLVVNGEVAGTLSTRDFGRLRRDYFSVVAEAFHRLSQEFELIVLEGAGSPAEINLRTYDIVNMTMATHAKAPVLLVGDIDRGGVFAALVGTITLLDTDERRHVKGWLINKFRGDPTLLEPGLSTVHERTGIPCLGVFPYIRSLRIPEEDSVGWKDRFASTDGRGNGQSHGAKTLRIGVIDLPYLSNDTDLEAFAQEPDVQLIGLHESSLASFDALIIPGTKNTAEGLRFLKSRKLHTLAHRVHHEGGTVVGLCGGFQMLGRTLFDPHGLESGNAELEGLGLLEVVTVFHRPKVTTHVTGRHRETGCRVEGYEIHLGRTQGTGYDPLLYLDSPASPEGRPEGVVSEDGLVMGTYVHGLFDSTPFRRSFLNRLRRTRGWEPLSGSTQETGHQTSWDGDLDLLADCVERHLDLGAIEDIIEAGV